MVGVVACAGRSTRFWPSAENVCKQLLPVYDKPLIYYTLAMFIDVGITEIYIIVNEDNQDLFKKQLSYGEKWGVQINYICDESPCGTLGSFLKTEELLAGKKICYVLGDNFFCGENFLKVLKKSLTQNTGATIFVHPVENPKDFGVLKFDSQNNVVDIVEKPETPPSNLVMTGLFCFDENCFNLAKAISFSRRGELEITDLVRKYLNKQDLQAYRLDRFDFWIDAGSADGLLKASNHVAKIQKEFNIVVSHLEVLAWKKSLISKALLEKHYIHLKSSQYGQYIKTFL